MEGLVVQRGKGVIFRGRTCSCLVAGGEGAEAPNLVIRAESEW